MRELRGKIKIAHVITGLNVGGAEMMLSRLLSSLDRNKFEPIVISLTNCGVIGNKIKNYNIVVYEMNMKKDLKSAFAVFSLIKLFMHLKIDLIQTWMYHADLIGGLVGKVIRVPVIWGIHNSTLVLGQSSHTTIMVAKINAWLSYFIPTKIICCSQIAKNIHKEIGYKSSKMIFIPNGFDCNFFRFDFVKRTNMRKVLDIPEEDFLIGIFARFDAQKDHYNFIKAAEIFVKGKQDCKFILCGTGITKDNALLEQWIKEVELTDRFYLLGQRDDVVDIDTMIDVCTLSSAFGEAFPLVLGEAMACEIPCVATNLGDSQYLIGDTGVVVPVKNPGALANAWTKLYQMNKSDRKILGSKARQRIIEKFSLNKMVEQYQSLYIKLLENNKVSLNGDSFNEK